MTLYKTCPFCGKTVEIANVDEDAYDAWESGEKLIQEAFPDAGASVREAIKTGMCHDCQEAIFGSNGDVVAEEFEEGEEWEDGEPLWDDWDEALYDDYSSFDEEGFDPYLGCYTGDC